MATGHVTNGHLVELTKEVTNGLLPTHPLKQGIVSSHWQGHPLNLAQGNEFNLIQTFTSQFIANLIYLHERPKQANLQPKSRS